MFLAEDTRLNRKVALKRVRPDVLDEQSHRRLLSEADDASDLAGVYVSLGERTRALDALERAYAGKRTWLPLINVEPAFDDLRSEPRFQDLLRRVGIPAGLR